MIRAGRRELSDDTWIRHHPKRDFGGRRSRAGESASSFWAGILRCSGTSPAFTIAGTPKGTASLRFAMRGYNEPNFAPWRIDGPLCPVRAGRLAKRLIGP